VIDRRRVGPIWLDTRCARQRLFTLAQRMIFIVLAVAYRPLLLIGPFVRVTSMITGIDICRAANLLIRQHGAEAKSGAAQRADESV
jgi:hypothetical protein